jgi:hypothetical protein
MNTTTIKTLSAALIALTIGGFALPGQAEANGQVSVTIQPTTPEEEQMMRAGLGIYAVVNGIQNGGITQNGMGNVAGLLQNGSGNLGVVHQEGDGHVGTVQQNGNDNAHGLFQFGKNTEGHVAQNGDGGTGATFQFGW